MIYALIETTIISPNTIYFFLIASLKTDIIVGIVASNFCIIIFWN